MNNTDPLAQLRGLHLPEPTSWFPPAIGWWLVAGVVCIIVAVIVVHRVKTKQRRLARQQAVAVLEQITEQYHLQKDDRQLCVALNELLKRCALTKFPRHDVASLSGDAWLAFLDQQLSDKASASPSFNSLSPRLDEVIFAPSTQKLPVDDYLSVSQQWLRSVM